MGKESFEIGDTYPDDWWLPEDVPQPDVSHESANPKALEEVLPEEETVSLEDIEADEARRAKEAEARIQAELQQSPDTRFSKERLSPTADGPTDDGTTAASDDTGTKTDAQPEFEAENKPGEDSDEKADEELPVKEENSNEEEDDLPEVEEPGSSEKPQIVETVEPTEASESEAEEKQPETAGDTNKGEIESPIEEEAATPGEEEVPSEEPEMHNENPGEDTTPPQEEPESSTDDERPEEEEPHNVELPETRIEREETAARAPASRVLARPETTEQPRRAPEERLPERPEPQQIPRQAERTEGTRHHPERSRTEEVRPEYSGETPPEAPSPEDDQRELPTQEADDSGAALIRHEDGNLERPGQYREEQPLNAEAVKAAGHVIVNVEIDGKTYYAYTWEGNPDDFEMPGEADLLGKVALNPEIQAALHPNAPQAETQTDSDDISRRRSSMSGTIARWFNDRGLLPRLVRALGDEDLDLTAFEIYLDGGGDGDSGSSDGGGGGGDGGGGGGD